MHRLAFAVALVLAPACKKEEGGSSASNNASSAPKPEAEKPAGPPARSGKIDLKPATTPTQAAKSDLPAEANPPGVPVVTGKLEVDRDVRFIEIEVGNGPSPVKGKNVKVHYSGWLTTGKKFDASVDRDEPIEFPFDGGMVIKGWDIGLASMKVGGKRRIIIPAELAYGDKEVGDGLIPAGSMLVFDVELLEANQ